MLKRTDWLHVHGRTGGASDSEDDTDSSDASERAGDHALESACCTLHVALAFHAVLKIAPLR